ncbi:MAG: S8 family peptidase [Bacteroidales bacterium]|nr:S8 family peptidase [Bacteroidales bacterium]
MKVKIILSCCLFVLATHLGSISYAEPTDTVKLYGFRIYFADKNNSPYSIDKPEEFLSPRAIAKRERFNIPITEEDLPVNPSYVAQIEALNPNLHIWTRSKWSNTVTLLCFDTTYLDTIRKFQYVNDIIPIGVYDFPSGKKSIKFNETLHTDSTDNGNTLDTSYFGASLGQLALHNGNLLQNEGYRGNGMLIAVLDGGWRGFDTNSLLAHFYTNNRLLGTYNILPHYTSVYQEGAHGTYCTSILGANLPNQFIGSAPEADFVFIQTEDVDVEMLIEEDYWVRGAELADSIGADVISSSLGYTDVIGPNNLPLEYSSCDGETSIASLAATQAAHKGIIVCVAAGNDGSNPWHKLSRPSDAKDILCVGAIDVDSVYAYFSSCGPSYDGRVKPDVVSCGKNTYFVYNDSLIRFGNGTSFATPIIAGLSACLWQAIPQLTSLEIMQIIRESSNQFFAPDTLLGYGIPNFYQAWIDHQSDNIASMCKDSNYKIYPNPCQDILQISSQNQEISSYRIFDITGKMLKQEIVHPTQHLNISISNLTSGIYLIEIRDKNHRMTTEKIIKK